MNIVDRDELVALLASTTPPRLVMALGPGRFSAAHIPGSETFDSLDDAFASLGRDEDIVVYCTGGHASIAGCRWLQQRGYRRVRHYPGGLADWADAGLPLAGDGQLTGCPA